MRLESAHNPQDMLISLQENNYFHLIREKKILLKEDKVPERGTDKSTVGFPQYPGKEGLVINTGTSL